MAKSKSTTPNSKSTITEADAPSWDRFGGLMDNFPDIAAEYLALNAEASRIVERKKELATELEFALSKAKEDRVRGEFFTVERVKSHHPKKISTLKLMECCVDQEVIDYCTEGGDEYYYVTVKVANG